MKKKTWIIGLGIIAVCLLIAFVGLLLNRSTCRQATEQELSMYNAYDLGIKAGDIRRVCTYSENAVIGRNTYQVYTSDALPGMLYRCQQIQRIAEDGAGGLYVQYTDPEGRNVTLSFPGEELSELAVYDPAGDILFHRLDGTVEVWERFASGIQWGRKGN